MQSLSAEAEERLMMMLDQDEGVMPNLYKDQKGNWTIGRGFNLSANPLPMPIINALTDYVLNALEKQLLAHQPLYIHLSDTRKTVILNIGYNTGYDGLMAFHRMWEAIHINDFVTAGKEIIDSELAENRKQRLAYLMERGTL